MPDAFAPGEFDLSSAYSNTATAGAAPAQAASPTGELTSILSELGALLQSNNMFSDFEPIPGYIAPQTAPESVLSEEALATLSEDEKRQISDYLRAKQDPVTQRHSAYERANQLLKRIGFGGNLKDFMALDRVGLQNLATQWVARGGGGTSASGQGQGNAYGQQPGSPGQGWGVGEAPGGSAAGGGLIQQPDRIPRAQPLGAKEGVRFQNEPMVLSPADAQVAGIAAQMQAMQQSLRAGNAGKLPTQAAAGMKASQDKVALPAKQAAGTATSSAATKTATPNIARPPATKTATTAPKTTTPKAAAPKVVQPSGNLARNRVLMD